MQLQVLEVAIALIAAFFVVSLVASAVVEIISGMVKKRSKDLTRVVDEMLSTGSTNAVDLRQTSVYKAMQVASRRKRGPKAGPDDQRGPSYISARSFADGVVEGLIKLKAADETVATTIGRLPAGPLRDRLGALQAEFDGELVGIKAGVEGWFDDTMDRLEGAYKRWSQWWLLAIGIVVAVGLNVSAIRIADSLWNDAVLRSAVADAAVDLTENPCPDGDADCRPEDKIEAAIEELEALELPVGWTDGWDDQSGALPTVLGMLFTGAAVMMGARFWFELLTRLAGARGGAGVPPKATADQGSATAELAQRARSARTLDQL